MGFARLNLEGKFSTSDDDASRWAGPGAPGAVETSWLDGLLSAVGVLVTENVAWSLELVDMVDASEEPDSVLPPKPGRRGRDR